MRSAFILVSLALFAAACGSGSPMSPSNSMGPMGGPSAGSPSMAGTWAGAPSDSSTGLHGAGGMMGQANLGTMTWDVSQMGSIVTGTVHFAGMVGHAPGAFHGEMSGDDMTFRFDMPIGGMMSADCIVQATGTAHHDGSVMTGSYAGSNSCSGPFTNGRFTMRRQ